MEIQVRRKRRKEEMEGEKRKPSFAAAVIRNPSSSCHFVSH
jgi:hypothetical protein